MGLLKVSSRSNPNAVAGAFAGVIREQGRVEVQVVGAGALNQAVKAVAIARSMLLAQQIELVCIPAFTEIEIDEQPRTAIQLIVERRDYVDRSIVLDPQLTDADAAGDLRLETTPDEDGAADLALDTPVPDLVVDAPAVDTQASPAKSPAAAPLGASAPTPAL